MMTGNEIATMHIAEIAKISKEVRLETIREFADRLKAKGGLYGEIWESDIDRVLKEMEDEP